MVYHRGKPNTDPYHEFQLQYFHLSHMHRSGENNHRELIIITQAAFVISHFRVVGFLTAGN